MTSLVGTSALVRLGIRRDRVVLAVWTAVIAGLMAATAVSVIGLYQTAAERTVIAQFSANNVLLRIFDGPAAGTQIGSLVLMEGYWLLAVLTGLAVGQTIVRHTRAEEESGRAELVAAAVVGRYARLMAAAIVGLIAALSIGAVTALAMIAVGLEVGGSVLTGATLSGVGIWFGAFAGVAAQIGSSARSVNAATGVALGASFMLRAIGDAAGRVAETGDAVISAWPSWLSPIGWGQQAQPFAAGRWWVLALYAVSAAAMMVLAHQLSVHRDVGSGMRDERPGPATAAESLNSARALATRLHRPAFVGWAVAVTIVGAAFGGMGDGVDDLVGLSDEMRAMIESVAADGTIVELFFVFTMSMLGVAASVFAVQTLLRVRTEEMSGRGEPVLAAGVSRHQWLASHLAVALTGAVVLLVLTATAAGTAYGIATGKWQIGLGGLLAAGLSQIPAVLALASVVALAVAVIPRMAAGFGWAVLVISVVLGQLGAILDLPQFVLNLSPFTHVPGVPAEPFDVVPFAILSVVAVALTTAAFVFHRRRDLVLTS